MRTASSVTAKFRSAPCLLSIGNPYRVTRPNVTPPLATSIRSSIDRHWGITSTATSNRNRAEYARILAAVHTLGRHRPRPWSFTLDDHRTRPRAWGSAPTPPMPLPEWTRSDREPLPGRSCAKLERHQPRHCPAGRAVPDAWRDSLNETACLQKRRKDLIMTIPRTNKPAAPAAQCHAIRPLMTDGYEIDADYVRLQAGRRSRRDIARLSNTGWCDPAAQFVAGNLAYRAGNI